MYSSKKVKESIMLQTSSNKDKTSFEIRIFDNNTGGVCYKKLSSIQLREILLLLDRDGKLKFYGGFE